MSVYTTIERTELSAFLRGYTIGELAEFNGICDGIENTNYFVTTLQGDYVLTVFEWLAEEELPYFLDLMAYLAEHGVPSAHPVADRHGRYLQTLKGKPAALVQRLRGASITHPGLEQCRAIGAALAHLHEAGRGFSRRRENNRGPHWWKATITRLLPRINENDAALMREELRFQALFRLPDLPRGVIHADLFRDNALFVASTLTGIIDFYYACNDVLLYDVAVTVNDWCSLPDGALDADRLHVLLSAYGAHRPFQPIERGAWPVMLRAAALRFWLSRLQDLYFPRPGAITHTKDPDVFKRILLHRIQHQDWVRSQW